MTTRMERTALGGLLGNSPAIVGLREQVRRLLERQSAARRPPPILILGETGTGKGLLARAIHQAGPRADSPFVDVNCAALPESLVEAEFFGFERGAFTDAQHAKSGLFQTAHRGTIFLDELSLLPRSVQAKLLKVVEEGAVRRLGSVRSEPVDVWILAAASDDLRACAQRHPAAPPVESVAAAETSVLREALEGIERACLLEALNQAHWNITRAAARLGIPRDTLRYRIAHQRLRPGGDEGSPADAGRSPTRARPSPDEMR
jgi:transcriptional regulator with PAS, ATPase and Fis domain